MHMIETCQAQTLVKVFCDFCFLSMNFLVITAVISLLLVMVLLVVNFIVGSNFIFLCLKLIVIHNHIQKTLSKYPKENII